jgi:branched-chain amino acid transport system substrate-binding protein
VGLLRLRERGAGLAQTLPIGVLFSTTGPYASLGREGFLGASLAIAEINEAGRLPVRLAAVERDPRGNTEAYAGLCRSIVDAGARFIVGCTTSWSRKEVIPVLEKTGTQLWYPCPYEGFEGNDHVVYVGSCPNQHIVPLLEHVLERFGRDPLLVGSNYIWGWETNRIARDYVEARGGRVKGERFVPLGDTDIGHIIDEVRLKRPDFVLNTLIGPSSAAFVEAYWRLGEDDPAFDPSRRPIISCNWTESEIAALGVRARGHLTIAPYLQSLDTPANARFLATIRRLLPAMERPSAFFAQAYAAVHMIARGLAATGAADVDGVLAAAKADSYEAPFGPLGIHAETNHAILTPHIARAGAAGVFEVVARTERPIVPDPYLARSGAVPAPLAAGAGVTGDDQRPLHLRVVK